MARLLTEPTQSRSRGFGRGTSSNQDRDIVIGDVLVASDQGKSAKLSLHHEQLIKGISMVHWQTCVRLYVI